ncbi:hypothetical protein SPSIL_039870 [Sporomusa silvacetica DSM 10669]|uniref:Aldehyde ferredoxin oxidoreductase N-terminal domain-containing protein n=1 Tax=Sporomusa silvacetica DSM 10669 TaxID=1123289 RepID=A0ABZ3IQV4_9FIRM|nr:aldehyde ferredoxin oxidoreductase N-terminal domain-containing protein [Sporomusa silvacetica]OZC16292.1 putative oxidoreductase YdhV [Sporomusa silvacetica DSM 10669]
MKNLEYGWTGKVLCIDLAGRTSWVEDVSDLCEEYIGCRGVAAKLAWQHLKPGTGAFEDGNHLIYMVGPCCGTPVLAGSRGYFFGVGPQCYPEHYTRSSIGGRCNAAMKGCGYDGIIIKNKSASPVIVEVTEDGAVFHDGTVYWGRLCVDTQKMIKQNFGEEAESFVIGPAGENKVRIAGIFCDRDNTAAQAGFGAVMGDKQLKAVVFKGNRPVKVADLGTILELRDKCMELKTIPKKPDELPNTIGIGVDGVGNVKYTNGRLHSKDILEKKEASYITQKGNACQACGVPCHLTGYTFVRGSNGVYHTTTETVNSSKCVGKAIYGWMALCPMELEWLESSLGRNYRWPMDFRRGAECMFMINNYGLNSWEIVSLFQWLTELESAGEDLDKLVGVHWDVDNPTLLPRVIEMLTYRQGFGDMLAEGMARCGETLGGIYKKYSDHATQGMCNHSLGTGTWYALKYPYWIAPALMAAVSTRDPMSDEGHKYPDFAGRRIPFKRLPELAKEFYGVDGTIDPDPALKDTMSDDEFDDIAYSAKEFVARKQELYGVVTGCGVFCDTLYPETLAPGDANNGYKGDWEMQAKLLTAVTGVKYTNERLEKLAERIWNLERCYNVLEVGRNKEQDMQICYNCHEGRDGDWTTGKKIDPVRFSAMLDRYYKLVGWDEDGVPTTETLLRLGLDDCAEKLNQRKDANG